jgi:hypothetical protein
MSHGLWASHQIAAEIALFQTAATGQEKAGWRLRMMKKLKGNRGVDPY